MAVAMDKSGSSRRCVVALLVAAAVSGLAGCTGFGGNFDGGGVVAGEGYAQTPIYNISSVHERPTAAAVSPSGTTVAVAYSTGLVQVFDLNGSLKGNWTVGIENCTGVLQRGIGYLDEDTLVASCDATLAAFALNGSSKWVSVRPEPFGSFAIFQNGSRLVFGYESGKAELWDPWANESLDFAVQPQRIKSVAASASGNLIALVTSNSSFYDASGELVREVPRSGPVAITDDGSEAFLGPGPSPMWCEHTIIVAGFSANATSDVLIDPEGGNCDSGIAVSPNGRYLAWTGYYHFLRGDVGHTIPFLRMIDRDYPARVLGFGEGGPLVVVLRDDGSGVGVFVGDERSSASGRIFLVVAQPGSHPPVKQ